MTSPERTRPALLPEQRASRGVFTPPLRNKGDRGWYRVLLGGAKKRAASLRERLSPGILQCMEHNRSEHATAFAAEVLGARTQTTRCSGRRPARAVRSRRSIPTTGRRIDTPPRDAFPCATRPPGVPRYPLGGRSRSGASERSAAPAAPERSDASPWYPCRGTDVPGVWKWKEGRKALGTGTSERREMSQPTTEEILVEFAIHVGYGDKRRALADDLARGHLTGGDLQMVCQWVQDQGSQKTAPARLGAILGDRDRWGPILSDLREHHRIRNYKQATRGGKKAESGAGQRKRDMDKQRASDLDFFGMTSQEYDTFKWRWIVADWFHRGHDDESLSEYMGATADDIESCIKQFRKGQAFDEALAEHAGK